jgi:hypothetical protein
MNRFANTAIKLSCKRDHARFFRHVGAVADVQESILKRYLASNVDTVFGKKFDFRSIRTSSDFRKAVPITTYDSYLPYLEGKVGDGGLTADKILLFEPTSGTTAGTRYIPYTKSLKSEFRRAVNTWLYDLYSNYPGLLKGKSYWAISPVTRAATPAETDIPIGFDDDSEYLGSIGRIIQSVFAVPQHIRLEQSLSNFRYLTSYHLLRAGDLALISVWNPTFLQLILEFMLENLPGLIRDISDGIIRAPDGESRRVVPQKPDVSRAREIEGWYSRKGTHGNFSGLWPSLELVSCWDEAESRPYAERLAAGFPGITFQGKGLLATEGIVSVPLVESRGPVPAYQSHYLEFLPDDHHETIGIADLEQGVDYTVILTTGGGLYRYNLHDRIRVRGRYRNLPVLQFTGRDTVSDVVGEKVEERHLSDILARSMGRIGMSTVFRLCAAERTTAGAYYILYVQAKTTDDEIRVAEDLAKLREDTEKGLLENYHYRYAREIGQLGPLELYTISSGGPQAYVDRCLAHGMREGDIKPVLLSRKTGWIDAFPGALLP